MPTKSALCVESACAAYRDCLQSSPRRTYNFCPFLPVCNLKWVKTKHHKCLLVLHTHTHSNGEANYAMWMNGLRVQCDWDSERNRCAHSVSARNRSIVLAASCDRRWWWWAMSNRCGKIPLFADSESLTRSNARRISWTWWVLNMKRTRIHIQHRIRDWITQIHSNAAEKISIKHFIYLIAILYFLSLFITCARDVWLLFIARMSRIDCTEHLEWTYAHDACIWESELCRAPTAKSRESAPFKLKRTFQCHRWSFYVNMVIYWHLIMVMYLFALTNCLFHRIKRISTPRVDRTYRRINVLLNKLNSIFINGSHHEQNSQIVCCECAWTSLALLRCTVNQQMAINALAKHFARMKNELNWASLCAEFVLWRRPMLAIYKIECD